MELQQIPSVGHIETNDFLDNYMKKSRPVVLKNFISKESPAWKKWSYDFFKSFAGDIKVNVYGREEEAVDKVASDPVDKMTFSNYLDLISSKPTELRLFLFNLMIKRPQLEKDIIYNDPTGGKVIKQLPLMFFGGEGSSTRNHIDIDMSHVFISQFQGAKRIWLFPPDQSALLYKLPYNFHSLINLKNVSESEYPALKYIKGYEAVIHPGDTLFMPSGWWHFIQYETEGYSISVRALATRPMDKLRGFRNIVLTRNIDNLMRKTFGKKWFDHKLKVAKRRADRAVKVYEK